MKYQVRREGALQIIEVKLGELPERIRYQMVGHHMMDHAGSAMAQAAIAELSVEEVARLSKHGKVVVVDANNAKTRDLYGVVPGARLLTSSSSYEVSRELPADKGAKLVFYCANQRCTASDAAAKRAAEAGYKDVAVLRAGIMGWAEAGEKTDKGPQS